MELEQAFAIVRHVVDQARAPISVYVTDERGEVVAAATMDGAAPDTRPDAKRKAHAAARGDDSPGVAAFADERRVGAVGVSGLPAGDDEALAAAAISTAGLRPDGA